MKDRKEFKEGQFVKLYASAKDSSAVGPFQEGDNLYVVDTSEEEPNNDDRTEHYGPPEEIKVMMKAIRVRLHELSGKPFVDINPKLGKELTMLKPEDGVFVHASHRAFDIVKSKNRQNGNADDEFKTALTAYLESRAPKPKHIFSNEMKQIVRSFQILATESNGKTAAFAFDSRSLEEIRQFEKLFIGELIKSGVINGVSPQNQSSLVEEGQSAVELFLLLCKFGNQDFGRGANFFELYNQVVRCAETKKYILRGKVLGATTMGSNGARYSVIFSIR